MKKIYLLALVFAIITGVAIFGYARQLQKTSAGDVMGVVVAVKSIPERTLITADMLEIKELSTKAINSKAITNLSAAVGKIANGRIEIDEQVLTSNLSEKNINDGGLAYSVPAGRRAYSIQVDDTSGVAGYIKQGDHVDVVASLMLAKSDAATTAKVSQTVLLLQNIEVLVTSTETLNRDKNNKGYTIITLAVTPNEALELFYAQVNGRINVVLRPNLETKLENMTPYMP